MKPNEAYDILRNTMTGLIKKKNIDANSKEIMAMLESYIEECRSNSHYDQVANVHTLVEMVKMDKIDSFLGAIQCHETLTHIGKI